MTKAEHHPQMPAPRFRFRRSNQAVNEDQLTSVLCDPKYAIIRNACLAIWSLLLFRSAIHVKLSNGSTSNYHDSWGDLSFYYLNLDAGFLIYKIFRRHESIRQPWSMHFHYWWIRNESMSLCYIILLIIAVASAMCILFWNFEERDCSPKGRLFEFLAQGIKVSTFGVPIHHPCSNLFKQMICTYVSVIFKI